MEFNKDIAVGLKFYIGTMDVEGIDTSEFIDAVQFKFKVDDDIDIKDETGVFTGKNKLTCKYYDDQEGIMYVHFDYPVKSKELIFFDEEEMIFEKIRE